MTHFEIETDMFVALGRLIAGERSELSPLPIYDTGLVSPEQHQRLLQSGLLEETDAAPTSELNLMLEALRTAQSSASLLITTQDEQNEFQIYYPPDGFSPMIMKLDQNKIIISCADDAVEEIISNFNRLPDLATEGTASFSCRLTAIEAESLAVIIDLNRQESSQFTDQAGSSPHTNPSLTYNANQIYQALLTRMDSSPDMWLFSILFSMFVFGEERTFPKIEQALLGLSAAGLVESKEQGYLLSNQVAEYTKSFSKPMGALILNVSYQPGDALVRTESLATFTAREGSLVLRSTSEESLLVNPIPPARVLEIATQALRKPISLGNSIHAEDTVFDLRPANNEINKSILHRKGKQVEEPPQPEPPESQSAPVSSVPLPQPNVMNAGLSPHVHPTILPNQTTPQKPPTVKPPPLSANELTLSEQSNNENLNQWQCACGNKNTGLFCPKCGSEKPTQVVVQKSTPVQPTFCRQCGEVLTPGARFCRNCGTEA